jgi:energy-coupling factor transporter ATP-binding protein EcfA2
MRITSFEISDVGPIKRISVQDMADVVVFAGPNGVGKTQLNAALITFAQNPGSFTNVNMRIEATCDEERQRWGRSILDTRNNNEAGLLRAILQRNQRRNKYQSSFLNFDSDRAIRNVVQYQFGWDIGNPLMEELGWDVAFNPLSHRYNDVRHSLFRMVEGQKRQIADEAFSRQRAGETSMSLAMPDILQTFKDVFWQLLAPKRLIEVNTREQQIYFETEGLKLTIEQLSSGEREVVNIAFDFLLREPNDCVIIFDEPELHLHPELSYKLLQALNEDKGEPQDILQVWFAGVHADIGGGYPEAESAIAKYPLIWMIDEARKFGLALNEPSVNQLAWGIQRKDSPLRQAAPHLDVRSVAYSRTHAQVSQVQGMARAEIALRLLHSQC